MAVHGGSGSLRVCLIGPLESEYDPLFRMACKMATGSGKTVVMAMRLPGLSATERVCPAMAASPMRYWYAVPTSRFKERLQVLRTDSRGDELYTQFDLVPPQYRDLLRTGKSWSLTGTIRSDPN